MKAQRLFSELTLLHKHGIDNVVFADFAYAAELLAQASEMGNTLSAYRLSRWPALSVHYYVSQLFPTC